MRTQRACSVLDFSFQIQKEFQINKVFLPGNLTRYLEVKHIPTSGNTVANFGMAMNERWTYPRSGEQRESVCFVEIEA